MGQHLNFIAAIDLGSSHIVGMLGVKNPEGMLSVIAYEKEASEGLIKRGNIYNMKDVAFRIRRIVQKLEIKIPGSRIEKLYVGISGQSIRSIEHAVSKVLGSNGIVTNEIMDKLDKECRQYQPESFSVLSIESPAYYVDGKREANPEGVACNRIEARYKLIVGRPALNQHIRQCVEDAERKLAGIFISPLALADAVLTDAEKELGSALIQLRAGVTSLAIYKSGTLLNLCIIPLGAYLVTKDIASCFKLVTKEAERIKKVYGNAVADENDTTPIHVDTADENGFKTLQASELNRVVEARMSEILENVYARLVPPLLNEALGGNIILAGGGSELNGLTGEIYKRLKMDVRFADVQKRLEKKNDFSTESGFIATAALLLKGDQDCRAAKQEAPVQPKQPVQPDPVPKEETVTVAEEAPVTPKKKGRSFFGRVKNVAEGFSNTLFNDEDYDHNNK